MYVYFNIYIISITSQTREAEEVKVSLQFQQQLSSLLNIISQSCCNLLPAGKGYSSLGLPSSPVIAPFLHISKSLLPL